jgi:HEAT repeat protein
LIHEQRIKLARMDRFVAREELLSSPGGRRVAPRPLHAEPEPPQRPKGAVDQGHRAAIQAILARAKPAHHSERVALVAAGNQLCHDEPSARREAAALLGASASPTATKLLLVAVEDPSERVRLVALNSLAGSTSRGVVAVFWRFLHDPNPLLRLAAVRGLANSNTGARVDSELMVALEDDDVEVRIASATALGWKRDTGPAPIEVIAALGLLLYDVEVSARVAATRALGELGDERGVFTLIRALVDESELVREAAVQSLVGVLGDRVVDVLQQGKEPARRMASVQVWWEESRVDWRTAEREAVSEERAAEIAAAQAALDQELAAQAVARREARAAAAAAREAESVAPAAGSVPAPPPTDVTAVAETAAVPVDEQLGGMGLGGNVEKAPVEAAAVDEPRAEEAADILGGLGGDDAADVGADVLGGLGEEAAEDEGADILGGIGEEAADEADDLLGGIGEDTGDEGGDLLGGIGEEAADDVLAGVGEEAGGEADAGVLAGALGEEGAGQEGAGQEGTGMDFDNMFGDDGGDADGASEEEFETLFGDDDS